MVGQAGRPPRHSLTVMDALMSHNDLDFTNRIIRQGRALVRAIESLTTIRPTGLFERTIASLLVAGYKRRLQAIVEAAPAWIAEEILSASEHIGDDRAVLWMSEN